MRETNKKLDPRQSLVRIFFMIKNKSMPYSLRISYGPKYFLFFIFYFLFHFGCSASRRSTAPVTGLSHRCVV